MPCDFKCLNKSIPVKRLSIYSLYSSQHFWDKAVLKDPDFQWIGCDFEYCKFWGHTKCLGVVIGDKNIKTIEFYCLEKNSLC